MNNQFVRLHGGKAKSAPPNIHRAAAKIPCATILIENAFRGLDSKRTSRHRKRSSRELFRCPLENDVADSIVILAINTWRNSLEAASQTCEIAFAITGHTSLDILFVWQYRRQP